MKNLPLAVIVFSALILGACGSTNNSNAAINGNWTATLTSNQNNSQTFNFTTSLTSSGNNGSVNVNNFQFSTQNQCFANGATETGAFTLSGNFSGSVSGTFQLAVQANPGGVGANSLTLNGTLNNNTISGTWNLVGGSGCSGSGNFTMTKM